MSKSLSILQTIAKVARIVCKVIFILCLVGGIGCLLGLLVLLAFGRAALEGFDLLGETPFLTGTLGCITGAVACAGEAVVAYYGERYFAKELTAGTPFTKEGAKEIFRLGLIAIIVSFSCSVIVGIVSGIFLIFSSTVPEGELSMSVSLGTGLFLLLISVIFQYGAELREHNFALQDELYRASRRDTAREKEEPKQETTTEDADHQDAAL